jgi:hypothetical protein
MTFREKRLLVSKPDEVTRIDGIAKHSKCWPITEPPVLLHLTAIFVLMPANVGNPLFTVEVSLDRDKFIR